MEKVADNVYIGRGFGKANVGHKLTREEATHGVDLLDRFPPPQERLGQVQECYRAGIERVYDELLEAGRAKEWR